MSGLRRRIKRASDTESRRNGFRDRKAFNRLDPLKMAGAMGPLHASAALVALERKLFARKPTAKTRNRRRVSYTPQRARPVERVQLDP